MRAASSSDFTINVEGIGEFVFARRTLRDEMRIAAEYSRLTEGTLTPTPWLELVAGWVSTLKVLTVRAPAGFDDFDALDPLDEDVYASLSSIHRALREKEGSFRKRPDQAGKASGAGDGGQPGVLVSPQVPAGAD